MRRILSLLVSAVALVVAASAVAQQALVVRPLAERKVSDLPVGELFWRIETYPSKEAAQGAAGVWSLVAEAAGKVWLFTLGPSGGVVFWRHQGVRGGAYCPRRCPAVLASYQRGERSAWERHSGPQPSRRRGILRACRRAEHSRRSWNHSGQSGYAGGRARCFHGNAGV